MDYVSKYVPECIKQIPVYMDFEGQKRAEKTFQVIIVLFGTVGFVWGYICQQFSQTILILLAGFILACLMTLPPWPMYRRSPLRWQPPRDYDSIGEETAITSARLNNSPAASGGKNRKKK